MKKIAALLLACVVSLTTAFAEVQKINAQEAARLVKEQGATLIDVREPAEWAESGVAEPALLLPTSDFNGPKEKWQAALAKLPKDKPVVIYCRSGGRAGRIAEALAKDGYQTVNAGAFKDWQAAGLPVRMAEEK